MKLSESSKSAKEQIGRSIIKEKGLAMVLAAIGVITAGVSSGCMPFVVAHGRKADADTYIKARKSCNHLDPDSGKYDDCMRDEIDASK